MLDIRRDFGKSELVVDNFYLKFILLIEAGEVSDVIGDSAKRCFTVDCPAVARLSYAAIFQNLTIHGHQK